MKSPAVGTYQTDTLFPKIARAVADILRTNPVVAPVEVLIQMGRLSRKDYEGWRFGRVPYLERVIQGNLSKANRILRILRLHAHDLNLRPSSTAYMKWGKGPKTRLRFSKTGDPNVEEAYARCFIGTFRSKETPHDASTVDAQPPRP